MAQRSKVRDTYGKEKQSKRPQKRQPTHFLCLPIVTARSRPQLLKSLAAFHNLVSGDEHDSVGDSSHSKHPLVSKAAFRPLGTLHLTIGVMQFPTGKRESCERHDDRVSTAAHASSAQDEAELDVLQEKENVVTRSEIEGVDHESAVSRALGNEGGCSPRRIEDAVEFLEELRLARLLPIRENNERITNATTRTSTHKPADIAVPAEREEGPRVIEHTTTFQSKRTQPQWPLNKSDSRPDTSAASFEQLRKNVPRLPLTSLSRAINPPLTTAPIQQATSTEPQVPFTVSLRGLAAFPSPANATVLHARPHDPTNRLHHFCIALRRSFEDAGLMARETRDLKLHVSLVNTIYAGKDKKRREKGGRRGRNEAIDARELLETFNRRGRRLSRDADTPNRFPARVVEYKQEHEEFVWAEDVVIDRVRICKMGAKAVEDTELGQEYEVVCEKRIFPTYLPTFSPFCSSIPMPPFAT